MGKLFIVATPIGNLKDITLRALEVLKNVDLILVEDSRVTSKLLKHYDIEKDILIYNQHTYKNKNRLNKIISFLKQGKNLALVTDAGTPGISDPGNELIAFINDKLSSAEILADPANWREPSKNFEHDNIQIIPIPGPSAVSTALSISGFDASQYLFIGFFPKKKKSKLVKFLSSNKPPFVYFDSPHRLTKNLEFIKDELGDRQVFVGRELTKIHETCYRGLISEVIEKLKKSKILGEMVIIINTSVPRKNRTSISGLGNPRSVR